jgi:exopolysaccharide biosynthesis predicted pyruvyltransferase EpsI
MLDRLKSEIDRKVSPVIRGRSSRICIIDPPGHSNVGDSAILLGELEFIAKHFSDAKLSFYDVRNYSPAADQFIDDSSIIVFHGGGNFGDMWPNHHRLRLEILNRFPTKPAVQMPQSIYFDCRETLEATAAAIKAHKDFTLFVRDSRSFELATKVFDCAVHLSPDMAFAMKPIRARSSNVDFFCLLRTDKEAVLDSPGVLETLRQKGSVEISDWLGQSDGLVSWLDQACSWRTKQNPANTAFLRPALMRLRQQYARQRVRYGVGLLSRGATVVTDRLHAHILSCLLTIPNLTFDSADGKISAFFETWTHAFGAAKLIHSPSGLKEIVRYPARA